jgi:hypothetical protein
VEHQLMSEKTTRRTFLTTSLAVAGGIIGCATLKQDLTSSAKDQPPATTNSLSTGTAMLERELGKTGVSVPIFGLGGAGQTPLSWENREQDAVAIIRTCFRIGDSLL